MWGIVHKWYRDFEYCKATQPCITETKRVPMGNANGPGEDLDQGGGNSQKTPLWAPSLGYWKSALQGWLCPYTRPTQVMESSMGWCPNPTKWSQDWRQGREA